MSKITEIKAIQVLDSRGVPTVSCSITLDNNISAHSIVPSGASTGTKEALELRDGNTDYLGKGVQKAVNNINNILKPALINLDPCQQREIDNIIIKIDGTSDKSNIGANAILAVSLAVSHVAAKDKGIDLYTHFSDIYQEITNSSVKSNLPMPMLNILNGGEHADNNIDIQEFMIIPKGAKSFKEAMRWSSEIYWNLKSILKKQKLSTAVGDEGGFAPNLQSNEEAMSSFVSTPGSKSTTPTSSAGALGQSATRSTSPSQGLSIDCSFCGPAVRLSASGCVAHPLPHNSANATAPRRIITGYPKWHARCCRHGPVTAY